MQTLFERKKFHRRRWNYRGPCVKDTKEKINLMKSADSGAQLGSELFQIPPGTIIVVAIHTQPDFSLWFAKAAD